MLNGTFCTTTLVSKKRWENYITNVNSITAASGHVTSDHAQWADPLDPPEMRFYPC